MSLHNPIGVHTVTVALIEHGSSGVGRYERTIYETNGKFAMFFMGKVREVFLNDSEEGSHYTASVDLRDETQPKKRKKK